ncbi:MAG TPA: tetratricopeptide repeat protein [Acetobacteraceae bacterium]|nr:tetratricopeptide repeat protein [Acetobacteraceae bacterium]
MPAPPAPESPPHAPKSTPHPPEPAQPTPDPRSLYIQGLHLLRAGQAAQAAELLASAVAALPGHEGVRVNLVRALLAAGEPRRTLDAADAALAALPDRAELHFARGTALNALDQPQAARDALQRAVALDPSHAPSHLNLGNACADLDDLEAAERHIRAALHRDPALAEAHASLGFVLTSRGRLAEAIAACDAAIALRPGFVQAHWNLATAALLAGDFARGFAAYEWRKRHDRFRRDFVDLPGPVWTGDDPAGRTILVHAEQGFGDTIQFARYLPLIVARGGQAVLACERPVLPLLATLPGVRVVAKDATLPRYDAWIDQMSLPLAFATRPDTIPSAAGYLHADPALAARWRERLPDGGKIGLAWGGNPLHSNDRRRSLPPAAVARLRALGGGSVVNLQVGPRAGEARLPDLSPFLTDYAETAALVATLDLVLTVDTSVAHVAGALGVPCWVMLPFAPDWRWMPGRDNTPWYASLRLFRQPRPGDWDGVIDAVAAALPAMPAKTSIHDFAALTRARRRAARRGCRTSPA